MISYTGVNPTIPLEDREKFLAALGPSEKLRSVVLNTCDRVEIYTGEGLPTRETLTHLLRVVCGLESPMLGENQIQSQVKLAYQEACGKFTLSSGMHRLFQTALMVGKKVRTETKISHGALGHAQTVVNILKSRDLSIKSLRILVIGVNNLNRGILKFLVDHGNQTFFLGNRTLEKAEQVCRDLGGGQVVHLDSLKACLPLADVVISATSAPHLIIHEEHMPPLGGPRWFFDLAVPRDIDPRISLRPGVQLFNVTDLEREASQSLTLRQGEVRAAELIIHREAEKFYLKETVHT